MKLVATYKSYVQLLLLVAFEKVYRKRASMRSLEDVD